MGISKSFRRVSDRFWFRSMRKRVTNFIKSCKVCQMVKPASTFKVGIGTSQESTEPWHSISIDLMGPYTKGKKGCRFLLVVVDNFTKYVELFGLRRATARVIIDRLWKLCLKWGFFSYIISDNAKVFHSKVYGNWCNSLGIQPFRIAIARPSANPTERYNRTVKDRIIASITECNQWDCQLDEIMYSINTAKNDSTGYSPVFLNFGREFPDPVDVKFKNTLKYIIRDPALGERMQAIRQHAAENLHKSQQKSLSYYNKGRKQVKFNEGDKVWVTSFNISDAAKGITGSLLKKYKGPFEILKAKSDTVYTVKHPGSTKIVGDINVCNLKLFVD